MAIEEEMLVACPCPCPCPSPCPYHLCPRNVSVDHWLVDR